MVCFCDMQVTCSLIYQRVHPGTENMGTYQYLPLISWIKCGATTKFMSFQLTLQHIHCID